jgi:streptomycin 6-kinase
MQIPESLQKKVSDIFGNRGDVWLKTAPALLQQAVEHWGLTEVTASPVMSHNFVCFAVSPQYGKVALKLGVPHDELFREMETLRRYDGHLACRMYDSDRNMAALLLERIVPGSNLWQITHRLARAEVVAGLLSALPVSARCVSGIPPHREVVARTFQRLRTRAEAHCELSELMQAAEEAERSLYARNGEELVLLHGDLNHWNILSGGNNQWRVIDPQGFVGPTALDAGRFMLNEMSYGESPCSESELPGLLTVMADSSGHPVLDLWQATLIDSVLSTCWHVEGGASPAKVTRQLQICQGILRGEKVVQ